MKTLYIKSTLDNTEQPSLYFSSKNKNRPLLVGLHTWSFDMNNQQEYLLPYAIAEDWNLLLPNFRGANKATNPNIKQACGSAFAVQDIIDATKFVIDNYDVDKSEIYLFGGSGGGQASLLATAYAPKLWNTVVSYVPIIDLAKWYDECLHKWPDFANDMYTSIGLPSENSLEYQKRSPINYIDEISQCNRLKIFSGKFDDIVSPSQALEFFNEMYLRYPTSNVFLQVFEGGHYVNYQEVITYFKSKGVTGMLDLTK